MRAQYRFPSIILGTLFLLLVAAKSNAQTDEINVVNAGGRTEAGVLFDATGSIIEQPISTRPQAPSFSNDETDWSPKAPMNTARAQFAAVTGLDGMIYVFAGYTTIGSTANLNSTERYNPATNTWESLAPNPFVTRGASYARGPNGKIYVISGWTSGPTTTNQIYDPDTNTWSAGAPIPTSRWEAAATRGPDGRIYFFGGETTNELQIYDTVGDSWTTGAPMPSNRKEHKAVLANDGLIYVIGGSESASVDVYDPSNDTWLNSTVPDMPARRNQFGAALGGDGKIYVIGGKTSGGNDSGPFFNEVSILDLAANTWTVGTDLMPTARGELVAVESQGTIYALGGTSGTGLATNEALQVGGLVITNAPYSNLESITVTGSAFDDSVATVTINGQSATFRVIIESGV
jgi:N-acetylneuraminic acid mutarotase